MVMSLFVDYSNAECYVFKTLYRFQISKNRGRQANYKRAWKLYFLSERESGLPGNGQIDLNIA